MIILIAYETFFIPIKYPIKISLIKTAGIDQNLISRYMDALLFITPASPIILREVAIKKSLNKSRIIDITVVIINI